MKPKIWYMVAELAKMGNVDPRQMKRAITNAGAPMEQRGRYYFVYFTDIEEYLPAIWKSILKIASLKDRGNDRF